MRILVGADGYGFELKESVREHLCKQGFEVEDLGVGNREESVPYYQIASEVAQQVGQGLADRGILVCGTGMGMSIIANKHPGVYAAVCETAYAAQKSRSINNANILTLGGFITTPQVAQTIVDTWLMTEFALEWEPTIQDWLHQSMTDIMLLEQRQFSKDADHR
ncbi:MAG TPA: RpiB/LacA/LacB family sugar-phosphate isomerase [Stenomitos sp.]